MAGAPVPRVGHTNLRHGSALMDLSKLPALQLRDRLVRPPQLPPWEAAWSEMYGRWYWWHQHSAETSWTWPREVLQGSEMRQLLPTDALPPAAHSGRPRRGEKARAAEDKTQNWVVVKAGGGAHLSDEEQLAVPADSWSGRRRPKVRRSGSRHETRGPSAGRRASGAGGRADGKIHKVDPKFAS